MTLYQIAIASLVVDATSDEDAIAKVVSKLGQVRRHLGNGEKITDCNATFLTLAGAPEGAVETDLSDPISAARVEAEQAATAEEAAKEPQTITGDKAP